MDFALAVAFHVRFEYVCLKDYCLFRQSSVCRFCSDLMGFDFLDVKRSILTILYEFFQEDVDLLYLFLRIDRLVIRTTFHL